MIKGKNNTWTQAQVNYLVDNYPTENTKQVAKDLGKSLQAIQIKAQRLALRKDIKTKKPKSNYLLLPGERFIDTGKVSTQGNVTVHRML